VIPFAILLIAIVKLLWRYLSAIKRASSRSGAVKKGTAALIICAPGALTLVFLTCFSGGWEVTNMVSLGLLWGAYRSLAAADLSQIHSII
jgi:hypothetical protein